MAFCCTAQTDPTLCTRQSDVSLSSEETDNTQQSTMWSKERDCRHALRCAAHGDDQGTCALTWPCATASLWLFFVTLASFAWHQIAKVVLHVFFRKDHSFSHNVFMPWKIRKQKQRYGWNRDINSQWKICVLQTVLSDIAIARLVIFFFSLKLLKSVIKCFKLSKKKICIFGKMDFYIAFVCR